MEARPSRLPAPSWPLEPLDRRAFLRFGGAAGLLAGLDTLVPGYARVRPGQPAKLFASDPRRKPGSHRSDDRRDTGSHRRPDGDGDDHQRHASWPSPEIPGRRRGGDPGDERAGGGHLGALARDPRAERYGRRPRGQLPRHLARRDLRVPLSYRPIRDVLVPQPLGIPGATGPLRPARHRPRRGGTVRVRPGLHRGTFGLDLRGSAQGSWPA